MFSKTNSIGILRKTGYLMLPLSGQVYQVQFEAKPKILQDMDPQIIFETKNLKRYKFPTHINDLVIDRTQSSFSEVFMVEVEPGKSVHHHKHDDTEQVFYIIKGTGMLLCGEKKKELLIKPGDVIRIPVSFYHSIRNDHKTSLMYLSVDCFGSGSPDEASWDEHVKVMCETKGWDYNSVVSTGPEPLPSDT